MWAQYRRYLVPTQLITFGLCGYLLWKSVLPQQVAMLFIVMQLSAVIGAWWADRLTRRLGIGSDRLPLDKS